MFAHSTRPLRVMLLDDHQFVLDGMGLMLSSHADIKVVGSYLSSQALFAGVSKLEVDVVVMDYCLRPGEVDGLNLIRALRIRCPQAEVLVLSSLHVPSTVALALRCGARGFMGKEMDGCMLPDAIRKVASRQCYLQPEMASRLSENGVGVMNMDASTMPGSRNLSSMISTARLTVREHEVLRCCLDGMTVTEIATKFSRSVKTISAQKQSGFRKLGLRNNNELFKIRGQLDGWQ
jgi:two-component system capsular synthesis response regulator RcsB